MKIKYIIKGLITFFPGFSKLGIKETGGSNSAYYCYGVWLRHLNYIYKYKNINDINIVAEMGPGDSIGVGICALLTGSQKYFAFDIMKYQSIAKNLKLFDELVDLFKKRTPIPDESIFPNMKPFLNDYSFPSILLHDDLLEKSLNEGRLKSIRKSIELPYNETNDFFIYYAPWNSPDIIKNKSVDLIISQAVLEHVDDLKNAFKYFFNWLKEDGVMSHQLDFKCHGFAKEWNGHWAYNNFEWMLVRGRRKWLINRKPLSYHLRMYKNNQFEIIHKKSIYAQNGISRKKLSSNFLYITDEDMLTSGSYILSKKK